MEKAKTESCVELSVPEKELKSFIQKAKDWALIHGELFCLIFYNDCNF